MTNTVQKDELTTASAVYVEAKAGVDAPKDAKPEVDLAEVARIDEYFKLVRSVGEECQSEPELRNLLIKKPAFNLYDGFEPSGRMHIAQGIFKALNVNKCTAAGGTFIFWVADWFGLMNDKMGGDLEKIKVVGQYFVEVWTAAGMDMSKVKFIWASTEICGNSEAYWGQALDIARVFTVARIRKCCQIMGRKENSLTAAQILYPLMQCADIFHLKADICQLGVDQRKVNMLARDYCDAAGRKLKPIILSHHMLYGLKAGQAKMSKSDPDSAIFMEDTEEDVRRKITNAYCPIKPEQASETPTTEESMSLVKDELKNPCLDYVRYIIFSQPDPVMVAGGVTYKSADEVRDAFVAEKLSEHDLKEAIIEAVNKLLEPVRHHFNTNERAKELLAKVQEYKKIAPLPSSLKRSSVQKFKDTKVHAIFAPYPSAVLTLETIINTVERIKATPAGLTPVLVCEDWSAFALNFLNGDRKAITAYYKLLISGVESLGAGDFGVVMQGEAIVEDPSDYWISVIHVGRKLMVKDVEDHLSTELTHVSQVVTALMHVGDVMALNPVSVCSDSAHTCLHRLAALYMSGHDLSFEMTTTETPSLKLQSEGDNTGSVDVLLLDPDMIVNPKLKKAFCEPQNVSDNPPLQWASKWMSMGNTIDIKRKEENGGNKEYSDADSLREDFASGQLHPGDLKPAVQKAVVELLNKTRTHIKSKEAAALKDFENCLKKMKKAKK